MATDVAQTAGSDISKDSLDIYLHPDGRGSRFANVRGGRAALLAWLRKAGVDRVVFEPTGAYHRAFERHLGQAGLKLVR